MACALVIENDPNALERYDPDTARIDTVEDLLGGKPDLYVKVTATGAAGLEPGNLVALRRDREPRADDIVAVRTKGKIEVARYRDIEAHDEVVAVATHGVVALGNT